MPQQGQAPDVLGDLIPWAWKHEVHMSSADEFRKNATQCGDLAEAAKSKSDREHWLSLQRFWLDRAEQEDRRNSPGAQISFA
jgi:hypothetical protein